VLAKEVADVLDQDLLEMSVQVTGIPVSC
jgi:hypothetical protein